MWETYLLAVVISIHALREEGDFAAQEQFRDITISIHALREEGDATSKGVRAASSYFYPRPPRGGRPLAAKLAALEKQISIHALREEGDMSHVVPKFLPSPFLSTPSARRATAKTETKSLFSYKLYNILHEFRRALIYNGSKNYPNHAK